MIEELTTYIKGIKDQYPLKDFIMEPTKGLHLMFEVKNGKVDLFRKELYLPKKNEAINLSDFLKYECIPRELHTNYLTSNKALKDKKIHSASPYCIKIKKQSFDKEWIKWLPKKQITEHKAQITEIKNREKALDLLKGDEKTQESKKIIISKLKYTENDIQRVFSEYFEKANQVCLPKGPTREVSVFQDYISSSVYSIFQGLTDQLIKLSGKDYVFFWLKNKTEAEYEEVHKNYLGQYIFNVVTYNKNLDEKTYGLSGFLNNDSNDKIYLKHLTANFDINFRIEESKAFLLRAFENYKRVKVFKTNPLPIFIDQSELNNEVIDVIKKEGNDVKFRTIIKDLFNRKNDLGNYYLFYFDYRGDLKDLDFVSLFSYKLDLYIKNIIPKEEKEKDYRVRDVFDFETKILQKIFSNQLIQFRKNDKIGYRYFEEIENNPKYITSIQYGLVRKYRKAFYDWVYKSRKQAVTSLIFKDILKQGIMDDLRNDTTEKPRKYNIQDKLNILFSLWNYFDEKGTKNDVTMANKIIEQQQRIKEIASNASEHIETDQEFAFAAGQIIYYLLYQSKAAGKTHALLEPFLQKTNLPELKRVINKTFNAYKHEIHFGMRKFNKIYGEIMIYELDKETLKNLTPTLLAGYFSDSIFFNN